MDSTFFTVPLPVTLVSSAWFSTFLIVVPLPALTFAPGAFSDMMTLSILAPFLASTALFSPSSVTLSAEALSRMTLELSPLTVMSSMFSLPLTVTSMSLVGTSSLSTLPVTVTSSATTRTMPLPSALIVSPALSA